MSFGDATGDDLIDGTEAFAYLATLKVPELVNHLLELQGFAIDRGLAALRKGVSYVIDGLLADINRTAVEYAAIADGYIIAKIFETQSRNRPATGEMTQHIKSETGPLGLVRVALIEELDKIINPVGDYGPFWRAQEFGTGTGEGGFGGGEIPSQEGRVLFGTFDPSNLPPDAEQRGLGVGHDMAFVPGGGYPGWGTIGVDLPGRHFLRDGATEAGERYIRAMADVQAKWLGEFKTIIEGIQASGGRTFIGRIEA